jgi:hypothetical protein
MDNPGGDHLGNRGRTMNHGERQHRVRLVGPNALPEEQDFVFMEFGGGELWLALRADRVTAAVLEDAWATYLEMGRLAAMAAGGHTPVPGCCPLVGHTPQAARTA